MRRRCRSPTLVYSPCWSWRARVRYGVPSPFAAGCSASYQFSRRLCRCYVNALSARERQALVDLYLATNGPSWTNTSGVCPFALHPGASITAAVSSANVVRCLMLTGICRCSGWTNYANAQADPCTTGWAGVTCGSTTPGFYHVVSLQLPSNNLNGSACDRFNAARTLHLAEWVGVECCPMWCSLCCLQARFRRRLSCCLH